MATPLGQAPEIQVRHLYDQLLNCWNDQDAHAFAALFTEDGEVVGFDGSQTAGRSEIAAHLLHIFASHPTPAYLGLVRSVRFPTPETALLRAEAGMVPAGRNDIDADLNAVQVLCALRQDHSWRIASFQSTPARFHGRPEMAEALSAELRLLLRPGAARPGAPQP